MITYSSKPMRPDLAETIANLKAGQRIEITHMMRIGFKTWNAVVTGVFRHVDSLATGIATDRVSADDIIVPVVHFTKDNKEMSSIAVDEHTKIRVVS